MYEYNRAICSIRLGKSFDVIEADIRAAARRKRIRNRIEEESVFVDWAEKIDYNLRTLTKE